MRANTAISVLMAVLIGFGLGSCSAPGSGNESGKQSEAAAALDLTGEWEQSNSEGDEAKHVATIVDNTITVYWLSKDGAKSLFWAGTIELPAKNVKKFTWESMGDRSRMDSSLLASQEATKKFTFENNVITYEVSALGVSWNVDLKRTSEVPAAAPAVKKSDFEVRIEGAGFASDYKGKPVILVSFSFTNNSAKAANFQWSTRAQAFQNGISLDDWVVMDGIDDSLRSADIQPGATVKFQQPYSLRDTSEVTVEVREQFTDAVLASQKFSVGQ